MKTTMTLLTGLALTVAIAAPARAQAAAPAASPAGKWNVTMQTQNGAFNSTLTIKLEGTKVMGTMESQMGSSPIEGQFVDPKLTFSLGYSGPQGQIQIPYTATVKGDQMSGSMSFNGQIEIPFTAERVKESGAAAAAAGASLTGKWEMAMVTSAFNATPGLEFTQNGEKITGTYTGRYGSFALVGTLKGKNLEFKTTIDAEGTKTTMTFWGEVSADGQSITKGTAEVEGLGDVTWTARRIKGV
jgi:hypothetical protein